MAKHRIRTKKQPGLVIEVEGPEYLDLLRQGLVLRVESDKPAASRSAAKKTPARPEPPAPADQPASAEPVDTEKEN